MDDIIHPNGRFNDNIRRVWYVLPDFYTLSLLMCRKLASIQIIIVGNTSKESLGAANGLAQAVACCLKGVAPSVASSLYSISLERHLLGGHFVFYFLTAVALTGMGALFLLPTPQDSHSD